MKPKAPKGHEWEDLTIKISGTPIISDPLIYDGRQPCSFEITEDNALIEVGMEVELKQPGMECINGMYVIDKIEGRKVWCSPKKDKN